MSIRTIFDGIEWTGDNASEAQRQGWDVFINDPHGHLSIDAIIDVGVFGSSDDAMEHVRFAAINGDVLALKALAVLGAQIVQSQVDIQTADAEELLENRQLLKDTEQCAGIDWRCALESQSVIADCAYCLQEDVDDA